MGALLVIDCSADHALGISLNNRKVLNLFDHRQVDDSEGLARLSPEKIASIRLEAMEAIKKFGHLSLNGLKVLELLKFNDSSVYFFHRLKIYQELAALMVKIEEINLQLDHFEQVEIYSSNGFLLKYFDGHDNVNVHRVNQPSDRKSYQSLLSFSWRFFVRVLKGYAQWGRRKKFDTVIVDRPNDYLLGDEKYENPFVGEVVNKMNGSALLVSEIPINGFKGERRFKADPRYKLHRGLKNVVYGEHILWRTLIRYRKTWKINCCHLVSQLNLIQPALTDFQSEFIWQRLQELQPTTNLYVLKEMAYRNFFASSTIKSILCSDENSLAHRVILNSAKSNGVKTFGIQHGAIGDTTTNYIYDPADFDWNPIPDLTLVWGDYWQNILMKSGNYPPDAIKVVGQLRTDKIFQLSSVTVDSNLYVYASQPIPDESYREKALLDVLHVAKNHPHLKVLIKPHPRENQLAYFTDRIRMVGCENVIVQPRADLYELLSKCVVLITCYSTVAIEALYFKKQVILLDYRGEDFLEFGKLNLGKVCDSSESLQSFVNNLDTEKNLNSEAIESFVEERAFKIDGKVAERILSVLDSNRG